MSDSDSGIWYPSAEQMANANVSEIIRLLGVTDYESYIDTLSKDRPIIGV
jgi:hypothetical protein